MLMSQATQRFILIAVTSQQLVKCMESTWRPHKVHVFNSTDLPQQHMMDTWPSRCGVTSLTWHDPTVTFDYY